MSGRITAMSITGADGTEVPLVLAGYRSVTGVDGLAGVRVRSKVRPRTGRNGSVNRTRYRDDALIVIKGVVRGEDDDRMWQEYDAIVGPFVDAVGEDCLLKWTAGTERALQAVVRLEEMTAPIETTPRLLRYEVHLRASDPTGYSQTEESVFGTELSSDNGGGMVMPFTFPITFNSTTGGVVSITNDGNAPTYPLIILSGYLNDPIIRRVSDGQQIVIDGDVAAGDTLEIDLLERTVKLNGTTDRGQLIDFESTRWFSIPRGTHLLRLLAQDFNDTAGIEVRYRHAYE